MSTPRSAGEIRLIRLDQIEVLNPRERGSRVFEEIVRNIKTIEVVKSTAKVEDGEIVEYQVELKLGFEYEG